MPNVINMHDFGAKGGGSTDGTLAIQSALNIVESAGGVVMISAGTCLVSTTLLIASNVNLMGVGLLPSSSGMLILDGLPAYGDADLWPLWHKDARSHLPEPWSAEIGKVPAEDREYELHYRLVSLDPLEQRTVDEMRTLLFKDGQLVADDTYTLQSTYYFRHEMQLLLEKAGFTVEEVKGDYMDSDATAEHDAIAYFARK